MLGFDREQQSSVEQLSFNKKLIIKKNHLPSYEQEIVGVIFFSVFHHLF